MISHAQLHQQRQGSSHRRDLIHALRRRLAFLDLVLPAQRGCSGVAHTECSEMTPQGQGKGLLPIWTAYQRGFGVRGISLALATRSGPDVAAMPSALPVPSSGTVKRSFGAQGETPGLVAGHF